jgi:hypothetical protein
LIDCLVRDLSDIGARLEFGGPTELPAEFRLLVVSTNMLIPAKLEWQRGLAAGALFTGPPQEAPVRKT